MVEELTESITRIESQLPRNAAHRWEEKERTELTLRDTHIGLFERTRSGQDTAKVARDETEESTNVESLEHLLERSGIPDGEGHGFWEEGKG